MKAACHTEAGKNIFEMLFSAVMFGATIGVALSVGQRFGWWWGMLAAPATFVSIFAFYSLVYWGTRFLPDRHEGSKSRRHKPKE